MKLTKEGATFKQNNQNFYVGDIESKDTIMFKDDFIIIGNLKSQKNIVAAEGLIVMGNITSKSIYVYKDLLCTGKINTSSIEVEGDLRELCNGQINSSLHLENVNFRMPSKESTSGTEFVEKENVKNYSCGKLEGNLSIEEEITSKSVNSSNKEESVTKNNVIKEREDVKLYDKVRHRVYGTGIITNLTTKGIYVEFNSGEVKRLDLNKVLTQGLLKKDVKRKSRECISPAKERLKKLNVVTTLEKIRVGSVILHETLGEGTIEEFNTRRIKVNFLEGGASSLDAKLVLKLKVMKVKIY